MAFCNMCGAHIADGTTTCAACSGKAAASATTTQGMAENVAGMLAYVTFIPAVIFLVLEPYNKSRFVRFHAFQCIFFTVAVVAIHIVLGIVTVVPFLVLLTFPLHALVSLGWLIVSIFLALKANQGQKYKLPTIGDMAEKQANTV
jgi:uncharacterized membrane protein